jgi:cytosine/adenosine deaminase-related metal-dependent hydrolase
VLRQATIKGARALGLAAITDSLTPGKKADLILVRANTLNMGPLNIPAGQVALAAQPRNIDSVWVDGVLQNRGGEFVGVDVPGLVRGVKEAIAGLSRRLGQAVV